MAGAILTSVLKRLSTWTPKASSSSSTELPSSAEQELQKLERTMKRIHALLDDAEEKDISDKSEQLRLRELKEVAYDAEDAVDEYEYDVLHAKVEARRQAIATHKGDKHDKVMLDLNSYHPEVSISNELADKVKDIRKRFEEITDDWGRISLREKDGKRRHIKKWKPKETTSYFDHSETFGREDEKDKIIKWLLQEEEFSGDSVSILSIVGMGGLGKTMVAQMSYNDIRVCQHFNLRGWVYVSENFDVASLMKKIYNTFIMNMGYKNEVDNITLMSLDEHCSKLKAILEGKMFFLVLDDVWNQKFELWSSLKNLLIGVGVGKILVTTRNERVARIMKATSIINLTCLSVDDSWLLFKKIARENWDHNYMEFGKRIVDKCGGLPLAIKVLAGILSVEDEEEAWVDLLESQLWKLDNEKDDIFPVLKLSYDHLPMELKQCFMYLSLFPKGSCLSKSDIVQQWMSHGFIELKGKKMEEDVGNEYFNEFLHRSILQHYPDDKIGEEFIMHDLIHDLAQSIAKDEYLLITDLTTHHMIPKTIRHVSVCIKGELETIKLEPLRALKHLRTLLSFSFRMPIMPIMDMFASLTCLRTLAFYSNENMKRLSDSIGRMKHLRYLDISSSEVHEEECKSIYASVYNLHYLQTLRLHFDKCENKLCRDVQDLISLRHLKGNYDGHLPRELSELANIQTFSGISLVVEPDGECESDDSKWCKIRDLKGFRDLRGFIFVVGLGNVAWPDVSPPEAYLKDKPGIDLLSLKWRNNLEEEEEVDERLAAQVLDSLQPHRNLRDLRIYNYPGVLLPTWLGHELPALEYLRISGMKKLKSFDVEPIQKKSESTCYLNPPAAATATATAAAATTEDVEIRRIFPSLEILCLFCMYGLEEWKGADYRDFPRLRMLVIHDCPKLRSLPSLSHLHALEISGCPKLRSLPSLPSLTRLSIALFSSNLLSDYYSCLPMLSSLQIFRYSGDTLIFPNDRNLDPLEKLSIKNCEALRSVEGLGGLPSLQHLKIIECPLLRISPDQRLPPNLQHVKITESPGAEEWYQNHVLGVSECQATDFTEQEPITTIESLFEIARNLTSFEKTQLQEFTFQLCNLICFRIWTKLNIISFFFFFFSW